MIEAPPRYAALDARLIRRERPAPPRVPAVRADVRRAGWREDARLFGWTYVCGLIAFLTWLA